MKKLLASLLLTFAMISTGTAHASISQAERFIENAKHAALVTLKDKVTNLEVRTDLSDAEKAYLGSGHAENYESEIMVAYARVYGESDGFQKFQVESESDETLVHIKSWANELNDGKLSTTDFSFLIQGQAELSENGSERGKFSN